VGLRRIQSPTLLALWRLHGVDLAMRAAWEKGVILSGCLGRQPLCWHIGAVPPTHSVRSLQPVTNALAFLPYANGVHYDAEAQRRPLLQKLMLEEVLPPLAYATDNQTGIWYEGTTPTTVVADVALDPTTGPAAYKVQVVDGEIVETRYGVGQRLE
jgi:hypothetical protein